MFLCVCVCSPNPGCRSADSKALYLSLFYATIPCGMALGYFEGGAPVPGLFTHPRYRLYRWQCGLKVWPTVWDD